MNISLGFVKPLSGMMKKYASLMPSVIITVVAILLFLPMLWLGKQLKGKMEESARLASSVPSLDEIPSKDQPAENKRSMDKLQEEADKVKALAVQSSQRDLITYQYVLFPEPTDPSSQVYIEFGRQFRTQIEDMIRQMNALDAPSDAEIRARTGMSALSAGGEMDFRSRILPQRQPGDEMDPKVEALCQARAKEISTYAHPSAFSWYEFWANYAFTSKDQALQDCWDTQTAFWIYKDVVDTIRKLNGASQEVSASPVKRLLGVSFSGPVTAGDPLVNREFVGMRGPAGAALAAGVRDVPQYVTAEQPGIFLMVSPTGRTGNQDIDVIHFAVSVMVDNRSVLAFMKELCSEKPHTFHIDFRKDAQEVNYRHNQITILQSDIKVVDKASAEQELYRYGNGAVMQLDLVCEYQFNRAGYDVIKPAQIKKRLGQETQNPAEQTPVTAAM